MPFFNRKSLGDRTIINNKICAHDYFLRLVELSLSCFKWENLPETCDPRYLELSLLETGRAVFFREEVTGELMNLRFNTGAGNFDVYGNPTEFEIYGYNGYTTHRTYKDCVPVYNNNLRIEGNINLVHYANILYDLDQTILVNANAQKTPVLIVCNENQLMTLRNLYRKYEENVPYIFADKTVKDSEISAVRTDAPYMGDRLWNLKMDYWNEALTFLGIANVSVEKKERLISDEVERTQGGVFLNRQIRLQQRELACEKINKMFGTNISVSFNDEDIDLPEDYIEGSDDNGELHNTGADDM